MRVLGECRRLTERCGIGRRGAWLAASLAGAVGLAGCASSDTAWQVIQKQQEKQAMISQYQAEQTRKNTPDEPHLMLSMIRQAQKQGRYFASLAYIDAYIKQYGRNTDVDALRADALRMTGQTADSRAAYQALLKTNKAAEGWHGLGLLAGAQGDFPQAAQDLTQAARLAPTNALVLNDLGYARLRAGDLAGARVPLGMAAELAPTNDKVLSNLALLLLARGDAAGAAQVMNKANLSQAVREQIYRLASQIPPRPVAVSEGATGASEKSGVSDVSGVSTKKSTPARRTARSASTVASSAGGVVTNVSAEAPTATGSSAAPGSGEAEGANPPFPMPVLQPRLEQRFGNPGAN